MANNPFEPTFDHVKTAELRLERLRYDAKQLGYAVVPANTAAVLAVNTVIRPIDVDFFNGEYWNYVENTTADRMAYEMVNKGLVKFTEITDKYHPYGERVFRAQVGVYIPEVRKKK